MNCGHVGRRLGTRYRATRSKDGAELGTSYLYGNITIWGQITSQRDKKPPDKVTTLGHAESS